MAEEGAGRGWLEFDSSAYMLLESTGDSEAECAADPSSPAAEDDAQSCSYGSSPVTDRGTSEHDAIDAAGDDDGCGGDFDEYDVRESISDEEGVVEQCRRRRVEPAVPETDGSEKSTTFDDFDAPAKSDKLFWETCLAS
ncbi:hypothetical protein M569_00740 [Genlisea aurea]|uniref:Uncharacterized protein n=1 Tax=Genlisea aurea TaxID=192259 RepID=S8EDH7_9LAMI|nr:hypothetical protein M569_00740 [Genlisea aurea]